MSEIAMKEEKLTLKSLQNHLIKTLLGSLALGIAGSLLTGYTWFLNMKTTVNELNEDRIETKRDISQLKKDISEIKITLNATSIYTDGNKSEVQELKKEISEIKNQQNEIIKLLYQINQKR